MVRTRLYLDIDGVLNASWNARKWRQDGDGDQPGYQHAWVYPEHDDFGVHQGKTGRKFRMEWNSRLIDALNSLDVDLYWLTTWRSDALAVGEAMGINIPGARVLHPLGGETTFPSIFWKYDAIIHDQAVSESPFIAVDDEWQHMNRMATDFLESLGGLVVSPDSNFGIEPKHIDEMRKYIAKHSV